MSRTSTSARVAAALASLLVLAGCASPSRTPGYAVFESRTFG